MRSLGRLAQPRPPVCRSDACLFTADGRLSRAADDPGGRAEAFLLRRRPKSPKSGDGQHPATAKIRRRPAASRAPAPPSPPRFETKTNRRRIHSFPSSVSPTRPAEPTRAHARADSDARPRTDAHSPGRVGRLHRPRPGSRRPGPARLERALPALGPAAAAGVGSGSIAAPAPISIETSPGAGSGSMAGSGAVKAFRAA